MKGFGAVVVVSLGVWSAVDPSFASWVYVVGVVLLLQGGFFFKIAAVPREPVAVNEPPYHFDRDEAAVVQRFRYFFTNPASASEIASTLSAMGLVALVLSPWLVYKQEVVQAGLIAAHVFLIGPMTKKLSPVYALRLAAHKGSDEAVRMAKAYDTAWGKIRAVREQNEKVAAQG